MKALCECASALGMTDWAEYTITLGEEGPGILARFRAVLEAMPE